MISERIFLTAMHCERLHIRAFRSASTTASDTTSAIVLLHPSPMSSKSQILLAEKLLRRMPNARVFAVDTPGYGHSSPLLYPAQSLLPYAHTLLHALDQLGVVRFTLYGSATGAQIAIETAKLAPMRVELLVADGACHFTDNQRSTILQHYFPSLAARCGGQHLALAAHMARALFEFFPWFDTCAEARLERILPPLAALHDIARDYLQSADYSAAYRLAFENERAQQLQALTVPTWITYWPDSILLPYTNALLSQPLPTNVQRLDLAPGSTRLDELADKISAQIRKHDPQALSQQTILPTHAVAIETAVGSAVLCSQPGDYAIPIADEYLHLPGLGLGELNSDAHTLQTWCTACNALVFERIGETQGRRSLDELFAMLEQTAALEFCRGNLELLQHWQLLEQRAIAQKDWAALMPDRLQQALWWQLDFAQLKRRLLSAEATDANLP